MPTVNAIASQFQRVAEVSTKFFGSNFKAANNSLLVQPEYSSISNLLKSQFGGQPALTNLIENYSDDRESFNETLRENIESLRESSSRVKESVKTETEEPVADVDADNDNNTGSALSTLGEFAVGNIPPQQRNLALRPQEAPRPEPPEKADELQNFAQEYLTAENDENKIGAIVENSDEDTRVSEVRDLVRNFNNAMSYLNENRGVSNRMAALADNFSNNNRLNESLSEIGISVSAQGFLALNETIFNHAINNNSDEVNSIISEGLTDQLDKNINLANYQGDKLFTSILDFSGQRTQDDTESLYGNNAAYARENTPRFMAMLT